MAIWQTLPVVSDDPALNGKIRMTFTDGSGTYTAPCCQSGHVHNTHDEAQDCWDRHTADKSVLDAKEKDVQRRCVSCGAYTERRAFTGHPFPKSIPVCDDHATADVVYKYLRGDRKQTELFADEVGALGGAADPLPEPDDDGN